MKMEQVCTIKKKKVEGVVCSKGVTLKKDKSFVYIKIDIARKNTVPRTALQNLLCL